MRLRSGNRIPVLLMAAALLLACGSPRVAEPSLATYTEEIEEWRAARETRLGSPDGWLTLIGLFWLEPGPNRIGSSEDVEIVLPADTAPPVAGSFTVDVESNTVRFEPAADVEVTVDGGPPPDRPLREDVTGDPDVLEFGRLRMHLIRRADRIGLRVKDPESPTRAGFRGLDYFPIDRDFRVVARFEPHPRPEPVEVPTVAGTSAEMLIPGQLIFELDGQPLTLDPLVDSPEERELFLIFRDETSGRETYGAGRYLYATLEDGRAVIDFNRAYNPPCAFTPYATCPLPPRANRLPVAIRAGEKAYGSH